MNNTKNIIAYFMKYTFFAILLVISVGVIVDVVENFESIHLGFTSNNIYFIAAVIVCITPFLWGVIYSLSNLKYKNLKGFFLGILLIAALSLSFIMKSL